MQILFCSARVGRIKHDFVFEKVSLKIRSNADKKIMSKISDIAPSCCPCIYMCFSVCVCFYLLWKQSSDDHLKIRLLNALACLSIDFRPNFPFLTMTENHGIAKRNVVRCFKSLYIFLIYVLPTPCSCRHGWYCQRGAWTKVI